MEVRFFFEFKNEVIQLPVNPFSISINSGGGNKNEEIISIGEINILRDRKLKNISFESFFPANKEHPYVLTKNEFKNGEFYLEFFDKIRKEKEPCRFIVSGLDINLLCSIEDLQYRYEGGDEDVHYSIQLKEFILYEAKKVTISERGEVQQEASNVRQKTDFAIGNEVIANGKIYANSNGGLQVGVVKEFKCKVLYIDIDKESMYNYYISDIMGIPKGWVSKEQLSFK